MVEIVLNALLKLKSFEFDIKKKQYFTGQDGVSPFALTTQVLHEQQWTPEVVERRQTELLNRLKQLWRLGAENFLYQTSSVAE